jgi:transposase
VERAEAEAIYGAGREAVVEVLLAMDRRIQQLEARVEKLERELARSSRNSSLPPSSDPPGVSRPQRGKDRSGRARGAQPGHEGHGRELLPLCAVDELVEYWPERCGCGHVFAGGELRGVGDPVRHQIEELPVIAARVIEHRCPRVRCPGCGERTRARLPADIASSAFGPRFEAAVAVLSVRNRVSRRDVVELGEELFGVRLCAGTVEAILQRTGEALADPYQQLGERVRASESLNMDETGWRTAGQRRALWGMFTSSHAFFHLAPDRHEQHAKRLLAGHAGIVTSDRWWAYAHLPLVRRQLCWSHLRRDFTAHAEGLASEKEFGETGLELCERVFWAWEVYQHTDDRRELERTIDQLQQQYQPIVRGYASKRARNQHCRGMARNLIKAWPALWTFANHSGVQPTNNHAERSLRGAVIYRKLSLGSQSEQGERRIERLLSASITCRLQRRSLFAYLSELLAAHARGDPTPSLA